MSMRVVPKKNYYILIGILIGVVVLTLSIVKICNAINNENVNSGYINRFVSEIKYKELDAYLVEPASNVFIYITYTGDELIYKMEKNMMKLINNYDLASNFIYVDVTEDMLKDQFIGDLNKKINHTIKINKLPIILYYKDGVLIDKIESGNTLFSVADFQKLLDNYEITN